MKYTFEQLSKWQTKNLEKLDQDVWDTHMMIKAILEYRQYQTEEK